MKKIHQSGGSILKYVTEASHHIISATPTLVEESRLVTSGTCRMRRERGGGSAHNKITCSYQHLPKGAKYTLRDGELRPFSNHLALEMEGPVTI